jgi:hypothetical protein
MQEETTAIPAAGSRRREADGTFASRPVVHFRALILAIATFI